jgi:hypothetical protein
VIKGLIVGEAEVQVRLDNLPRRFREELAVAIGRLAPALNRNVQQDKLSGQVLKVKSGKLRRSIHDVVVDNGDKIVGIVSTNVDYGIGWETGWKDYSPKGSLKAAKAKFKPGSDSGGDTFKNGSPKQRSFLRSALKDMAESGVIAEEINASIERAKR